MSRDVTISRRILTRVGYGVLFKGSPCLRLNSGSIIGEARLSTCVCICRAFSADNATAFLTNGSRSVSPVRNKENFGQRG